MIKKLHEIELKIVHTLIGWSQSEHWFFGWLMYFISWSAFREFFRPKWYTDDLDFYVVALTTAIVVAIVEYGMKYQQKIQLDQQTKQMEMLDKLINLLVEVAMANSELLKQIDNQLDVISEELDENENNDKSQRED